MRLSRSILSCIALLAISANANAQNMKSSGLPSDAELKSIRAATEKYRDVKAAIADGYILPMAMCVDAAMEGLPPQLGAMGLHYIRPDLLKLTGTQPRVNGAGTHMDFHTPAVLIYEPKADGTQELVAIENLVWAKPWKDAGNQKPPAFAGNDYYYMHDNPETAVDEAHGFEPHYELHFWLYKQNPAGMFAQFNGGVTCENYKPAK
jgi:hypothetical protein